MVKESRKYLVLYPSLGDLQCVLLISIRKVFVSLIVKKPI